MRLAYQSLSVRLRRIRWMPERGVRLLAGTDAGAPRAVFDGFASSLECFQHIGMTPAESIDLATAGAAEARAITHGTGRLAPGHRADLLVVDGNPLPTWPPCTRSVWSWPEAGRSPRDRAFPPVGWLGRATARRQPIASWWWVGQAASVTGAHHVGNPFCHGRYPSAVGDKDATALSQPTW